MKVQELMTPNPAVCTPTTSLEAVARLMVKHDCGAIPVCEQDGSVVGVVTDRDITVRLVAEGKNPLDRVARDAMSAPVATVLDTDDIEACFNVMEGFQVRRAVVVDAEGKVRGMVSQADIARGAPLQETGEVVKEVSRGKLRSQTKNHPNG